MPKNLLPSPRLNLSAWAKLLLAAGLLLTSVLGLMQLPEVQNFFFPGRYHEIKLRLIKKEYAKVNQGLASLHDQLGILTKLQARWGQPDLAPSSRPLSGPTSLLPAPGPMGQADPSWQAAIHAAKKKQVYVARKLNHLRLILESMQRDLEAELSGIGPGVTERKSAINEFLQQSQKIQALWQTYHDNLDNSSIKLKKFTEFRGNLQAGASLPANDKINILCDRSGNHIPNQ
jgi:hypothetical protein